jgi:hypothetical protein
MSILSDILTKREYLYRQLLSNNNKIINLPLNLTNNSQNMLLNEIKSSYNFINSITYVNEFSKLRYYYTLQYFNIHFVQNGGNVLNFNNLFNLNLIIDNLFSYFYKQQVSQYSNSNLELYKNQYRPLRKGINNMLRLHATGAIAMPTEIRLQLLASSKDVIHS